MSARLLVNENFPAPSLPVLREAGLDVLAIEERCPGVDDEHVMQLAVSERRWLITFDRDYGELIFRAKLSPPPAVILLRVPSYRPEEPGHWLLELVENPKLESRFSVFDGKTIRSRPFLTAQ